MSRPIITAFDWVPPFARGQVRDLRVRWALEEVGQPYTVRYLAQGEQKQAPHRGCQPFGQVPTYEQDGLALFESGAIVLHIAERYGGNLLPADQAARARAIGWMFAALNTVEPPITDWTIATIFDRDKPWSAPRVPAARQRVDERLGEVAARLGNRDWLDGDDFTAGDLLMVAVLRVIERSGLLAAYPALVGYLERGTARPAFRRALEAQLAGFTAEPPAQYREWLARQAHDPAT